MEQDTFKEILEALLKYLDRIDTNEIEIDKLTERMNIIEGLKIAEPQNEFARTAMQRR